MATTKGIQKTTNAAAAATTAKNASGLGVLITSQSVQQRFEKMLGKKSAAFLSSLLTLVNNTPLLAKANPRSVLAAAATAASLDLPINPSLGKAWIVPYKGAAQFQVGFKGLIELAQRSGRMKFITMTPVYEGEIQNWNRFTETYTPGERESDTVVGYFASFELLNGFKKSTYWTKDEVIRHAKRFSKAFNNGPWQTDFDAMACKTVLLSIMKTYAPLSIEMQNAIDVDGKAAMVNESTGDEEYIDIEVSDAESGADELSEGEAATADGRVIDTETGELFTK